MLQASMLQPTASDPAPGEEAVGARAAPPAGAAPTLAIDPSWRAGRKLEEARKQLGMSLQQASDRIRVRVEFLEALEAMNAKLLPGKAYALAYLKSYARLLGLDEAQIVEQFQAECALSREDAQPQIRAPSSRPHPERPWLAAAAIIVLATGFVIWRAWFGSAPAEPGRTPAGAALASPAANAAPAAPSGAERRELEIRALGEAWLEARGPDGTVFLSETLYAGDVYRPDPSAGWTLHARDGGQFEIFVNGASAGLLGPTGMPVLGRPIDAIEPQS